LNGSTLTTASAPLPIRRNTALLAASMAVNSAVLQLVAAVAALTFALVTGFEALLGLGPAIFLTASALSALPLGRAMDRFGRVPVIVTGYLVGAAGCALTALASRTGSAPAVVAAFALIGFSNAAAFLTRTAAGDMYPPERRARGISFVLFGAVFGAILGPSVFGPLFAGKDVELDSLTIPWLTGSGLFVVAAAIVLAVRPDPKRIGELLAPPVAGGVPQPAAPLSEILRRPGVVPAMVAALASFAVMVSVMNLTGYVVVDHHHHEQHTVFPIVAAHVIGMFGLVLVVGALIDRIGRTTSLGAGLIVMAASCAGLLWFESVWAVGVLLFGLGLGWNVSFVAATAQLADRTMPSERGRLLGATDLASSLLSAGLALLGGVALEALGVAALALGAAALALAPVLFVARRVDQPAPAPESR
jgi:MFS family permease